METFGAIFGYALIYPLAGMTIMLAGHAVGEVVLKRSSEGMASGIIKYLHLAGLGFVGHVVITLLQG